VFISDKFTSHNRLNIHFLSRLNKIEEPVQSIGVGQGELLHAVLLGGSAEFFNRTHAPAFGVVGMDIKMDKIHDIFTAEAQRTQRVFLLPYPNQFRLIGIGQNSSALRALFL